MHLKHYVNLNSSIPLLIQGMKQTTPFTDDERENQEAIARTVVEDMIQDAYYIFGPGKNF